MIGVAGDHEMISSPAGCWAFTSRASVVGREVAQGSSGVRTCSSKTMDRQTRVQPGDMSIRRVALATINVVVLRERLDADGI